MNRYWLLPVVIPAGVLLASCGRSPEGLFVDHCKTITANLVGGDPAWTEVRQIETTGEEMRVNLAYAVGDSRGTSSCLFVYLEDADGLDEGEYETSPTQVVLNNKEVSSVDLLKASRDAAIRGIKDSAKQIDAVAAQATEKAREVAGDAAGKARELAHDAAGKVKDAAGNVQQALEK